MVDSADHLKTVIVLISPYNMGECIDRTRRLDMERATYRATHMTKKHRKEPDNVRDRTRHARIRYRVPRSRKVRCQKACRTWEDIQKDRSVNESFTIRNEI